jgi:hypothetical protein
MTNKLKKPTIDDLKKHLFKYKDATIIVGNDAISDKEMFLPYSDDKHYSRKSMKKTPKEFWNFYEEKVYKEDADSLNESQQLIEGLIDLGIVKTLVDDNSDGTFSNCNIRYIPLQGNYKVLKCNKCKKEMIYDSSKIDISSKPLAHNMYEDTECDGTIVPTLPFANSIMNADLTEELEEAIFNLDSDEPMHSHTLIFIGVDFDNNIMHYIADKFSTIKNSPQYKNQYPDDTYYIVIVSDGDELPIVAYNADFGTEDKIEDSLGRLSEVLKS